MNIRDVKRIHQDKFPNSHFFDRDNMKHAGQTLKDFKVERISETGPECSIRAPIRNRGKVIGETIRIFNAETGTLSTIH